MVAVDDDDGDGDRGVVLPFSWQQVSLHAAGVSRARVRITPVGEDGLSVELADEFGQPVLSVGSLLTRPVSSAQLDAALSAATGVGRGLLELVWSPVTVLDNAGGSSADRQVLYWPIGPPGGAAAPDTGSLTEGDVVVWEWRGGEIAGAGALDAVRAGTHQVLAVLQSWLVGDRAARLVVLTHGAVGLAGADITDLAGAAIWGLVRSAQSENPGQIVLVDSDAPVDAARLAASGEPQLLVRGAAVYAARLAAVGADNADGVNGFGSRRRGVDHRWHRDGRWGAGPPPGRPLPGGAGRFGQPQRHGQRRCGRTGGRFDPGRRPGGGDRL